MSYSQVEDVHAILWKYMEEYDKVHGLYQPTSLIFNRWFGDLGYLTFVWMPEVWTSCSCIMHNIKYTMRTVTSSFIWHVYTQT